MNSASSTAFDSAWVRDRGAQALRFLATLRQGEAGRYVPCLRGATAVGREMGLGWSCFALKLQHMLGTWEKVPASEREAWIGFIRRFQRTDDGEGAFIDPPETAFLERRTLREQVWKLLGRGKPKNFARSIILAETKQAIATLAEVGAEPLQPFRGFPQSPREVRAWLEAQDWSRPWGAGGQSAGLIVFLKTQAPLFLAPSLVEELLGASRDFYAQLADPETGAYFRGPRPNHGQLINGAMKVLMALDWLEVRPHFPEQLAATCRAQLPAADGCHLVDAVYVLHQTLAPGKADVRVRGFCQQVLEMIKTHARDDGGFSFYARRAQTHYYGVPISRGLPEGDIHGTCLLVWALAMIWRLLAPETAEWKPMRP